MRAHRIVLPPLAESNYEQLASLQRRQLVLLGTLARVSSRGRDDRAGTLRGDAHRDLVGVFHGVRAVAIDTKPTHVSGIAICAAVARTRLETHRVAAAFHEEGCSRSHTGPTPWKSPAPPSMRRGALPWCRTRAGLADAPFAARFEIDAGGFVLLFRTAVAVLRIHFTLPLAGWDWCRHSTWRSPCRRPPSRRSSRVGSPRVKRGTRSNTLTFARIAGDLQIDAAPVFPRRPIVCQPTQHRLGNERLQKFGGVKQLHGVLDLLHPENAVPPSALAL